MGGRGGMRLAGKEGGELGVDEGEKVEEKGMGVIGGGV